MGLPAHSAPLPDDLRGADLRTAALRDADLRGADLSGAILSGADLSGAQLQDAKLIGAALDGAVLHGANLHGAELANADLRAAVLDHAIATEAGFGGCNLDEASLFETNLSHASFPNATLRRADLRRCTALGARFQQASLEEADCSSADFAKADVTHCGVRGARFHETNFRGARLRGLRGFERASFLEADIRDVDFSHAHRLRRFMMDQNYLAELRQQGPYHNMVYWVWWATSDCGRSFLRLGLWIAFVTIAFGFGYQVVGVDYGSVETSLSPFYFSLVTLTTLGYGDVLPNSTAGQAMVMAEVVLGYMLLGGMISIFANKVARRAE
ncbi:MAG: pentapeptide repeat-containing protein [Myxococcota bacterium]